MALVQRNLLIGTVAPLYAILVLFTCSVPPEPPPPDPNSGDVSILVLSMPDSVGETLDLGIVQTAKWAIDSVTVRLDDTASQPRSDDTIFVFRASPDDTIKIDWVFRTAGTKRITVRGYLQNGQQKLDSILLNIKGNALTGIDTVPPTIRFTVDSAIGDTLRTNLASPAISGQAHDDNGVKTIAWHLSGATVDSGNLSGTNSWSMTGLSLHAGASVLIVTAVDTAGHRGSDTLFIVYAPASRTVSIGFATPNSQVAENIPSKACSLTVLLSARSNQVVSVHYALSGGAAVNGKDFTISPGSLMIAAGDSAGYIVASILDDSVRNGDRSFFVTLSAPSANAQIGSIASDTCTIIDNEQLSVFFSSSTSSGPEAKSPCSLRVQLSTRSASEVTVNYGLKAGGSAASGRDFVLVPGILRFPPDTVVRYIIVTIVDNNIDDGDKAFTVVLSQPSSNALLGAVTEHTYTIVNDDHAAASFVGDTSSVLESAGVVMVPVRLSCPSASTVTVSFGRTGGTAGAGDYTLSSAVLTLNPGDTVRSISFLVNDNTINQDSRTIILSIYNPVGAGLGAKASHTVTIRDDDPLPVVGFAADSSTVSEIKGPDSIVVRLNAASGRTVSVAYATVNGTAVAGLNYQASNGTVTFGPGVVSQTIAVPVIHDGRNDPALTFGVVLSSPSNASAGKMSHTVTILDQDPIPADVICVKASAQGAKNGSSWYDAYDDLQAAITDAASSGKRIWIAVGTYYPRTSTGFTLEAGVRIYGGFADGELGMGNRDSLIWRRALTVITDDRNGNGVVDSQEVGTLVDCQTADNALLDGIEFALAAGNALRAPNVKILANHCLFTGLQGSAIVGAGCIIDNCVFADNTTSSWGAAFYGFGHFANCIFYRNSAATEGGAIRGIGGVSEYRNCTFVNNSSATMGGAIAFAADTVANCLFLGNRAPDGHELASGCYITCSMLDTTHGGLSSSMSVRLGPGNDFRTPWLADTSSLFGPDGHLGGGDDGLMQPQGAYGRDSGCPSSAPATDIVGRARPQGSGIDKGAYEQ